MPPPLALTAVLALWTVIDAGGNIAGAFLNGAGVIRAQLLIAVTMALCSFCGKWWLVGKLGAWGSVLATILAYCLISVPGLILLLRRVFKQPAPSHLQTHGVSS